LEAVDIYTIIFAALAVFILLRLRGVLGQRPGSKRPFRVSALAYRLSMIAAVLGAVLYVADKAQWHSRLEAAAFVMQSGLLANLVRSDGLHVVAATNEGHR
jgi:hypothetical protein